MGTTLVAACGYRNPCSKPVAHIQPDTEVMKSRLRIEITPDTDTKSSMYSLYNRATTTQNPVIEELREAITTGNKTMVMYFLEDDPSMDLLNVTFRNGDNCLHLAAKHSMQEIIKYLLEQGAASKNVHSYFHPNTTHVSCNLSSIQINAQNPNTGDTALHIASRLGDLEMAKLLIEYDAELEVRNNDGDTAKSIAKECRHRNILKELNKWLILPQNTHSCLTPSLSPAVTEDRSSFLRNFAGSVLFASPNVNHDKNKVS